MTEETTQAVVEPTNVVAQPTATGVNAQGSELESFLAEYESGTKPQVQTPPVQQQPSTPDLKAIQDRLERFERTEADKQFHADLQNAIKTVKGDLDIEDYAVEGWINAKARENKAIQDIWNNRQSNPAAANRLLAGMKKEFAGKQRKGAVDHETTADVAAVAHAVRGASTKAPDSKPPNLSKMTNHEFNQYLRDNGINNAV